MKLNGIKVVERFNIPGTLDKVALRAEFINNGEYYDPVEISSVSLFKKTQNVSPSTVLASSTQLISDSAASAVVFRWAGTKADTEYGGLAADASSIYKLGTGRYIVVLDGTQAVSSLDRSGTTIENSASAATEYIDVWTIKHTSNGDYQVVINEVKLFPDNFITLTEPLIYRTTNKLIPNKVRLGETIDLKVTTEMTVMNKNIDQSIKNLLVQSLITDPMFIIKKHNEDHNLPARVTVSGYADTSADIRVTSDSTMLWSFNTAVLTDGSIADLGAGTGTYSLEAKYSVLNETIVTPLMYFTVR